ncbi:MAG: hypothetical protein AB8B48_21145 [Pseudomonadales bacterium]
MAVQAQPFDEQGSGKLDAQAAIRHYDNMPPPGTPNAQTATYFKMLAATKGRRGEYSVPVVIWEPDCVRPRCQVMSRITQDTQFFKPPGTELDANDLKANTTYEIWSASFHERSSGLVTQVFMMPQDYESYTGPGQEESKGKINE